MDIDDLICDAQDYYFNQQYEEAIQLLEEGKKISKDGELYELLVLCWLELQNNQKAFETAKEWRPIAKRDTFKKCLNYLMKTSYLMNQKQEFKQVCHEMIELDENIEEIFILYYDMYPEEKEWILQTLQRKKRNQPDNMLLKEIQRRIEQEEMNEKERLEEIGEMNYCIGLMICICDIMKNTNETCENEKNKMIEFIEEIKGENTLLINTLKVLRNEIISIYGIHMVLRKYGRFQ